MSSPAEWYNSLPLISRAYGTLCLASTVGYHLGVIKINWIYLDYFLVFRKLQIWRLVSNLAFLGPFSMHFGLRLLMIARYGVQLEQITFEKRTADFLWMMMSTSIFGLVVTLIIPPLHLRFLGSTLCFMLIYVWSREFPTARVNIMGVVNLEGFYLPWALLAVNTIFGAPFAPDLLGIIIGHIYYFFTKIYPRNGGRTLLQTPKWVFQLLAKYGIGEPPRSFTVSTQDSAQARQQVPAPSRGRAFTGRSYRLDRD